MRLKIAILAMLTVIAYSPAMRGPFVFDDDLLMNSCEIVGGCPIPVFHDARFFQHVADRAIYHFYGPNPTPFHLFSLAIHLINGLLVLYVAKDIFLLGNNVSLLALGLFWLHPAQSQAVIYIAQACEPLCALGIMVSFIGFARSKHVLTILGLIFALGGKEIALMIPLLWTIWLVYRGEAAKHRLKLLLGFMVLSLMSATHTVANAFPLVLKNASLTHLSSVFFLALKFLIPVNLTIDHDLRFLFPLTIPAVLITCALAFVAIAYPRTILGFGLMWIAVLTIPHVLAEPLGYLAEHHFYSPSIGICIMLAVGISQLTKGNHEQPSISTADVECY